MQHPLEVNHAKGSARLLHLSLPHSRLVTGEMFDPAVLQGLLTAPLASEASATRPKHALLLFPDTPEEKSLGLPVPPVMACDALSAPSQLRLIVLDGTWRKSRKMLYQNPLLQQLPRLALRDVPVSHYLIRKAHQPDQLSTLEATCLALMQLEACVEPYMPLLKAFDGFVAEQLACQSKLRIKAV